MGVGMDSPKVWVMGDEWPAEALVAALPGSCRWGSDSKVGPHDKLVVVAEGLGGDLVGLERFEDALAQRGNTIRHALVLAFQAGTTLRSQDSHSHLLQPHGLVRIEPLPESAARIHDLLPTAGGEDREEQSGSSEEQWLDLAQRVRSKRSGSFVQRHHQRGAFAALVLDYATYQRGASVVTSDDLEAVQKAWRADGAASTSDGIQCLCRSPALSRGDDGRSLFEGVLSILKGDRDGDRSISAEQAIRQLLGCAWQLGDSLTALPGGDGEF